MLIFMLHYIIVQTITSFVDYEFMFVLSCITVKTKCSDRNAEQTV